MAGGNTRARVRPSTPAEIAASEDATTSRDLAPAVEADAEGGEYDGYLTVTLNADDGPVDLLVKPQSEWRRAENTAIRTANWDDLASLVMPDEDYQAWVDADPTNGQVLEFMSELGRQAGLSLGPTSRSSRSSKSGRRR